MREIEKYIKEAMERKRVSSYRQLSLTLGMSHNEIPQIMSKGVTPSDTLCMKLAEFAGDDPEKVLLLAQLSKAPEVSRPIWNKILLQLAKSGVFTLTLPVLLDFQVFSTIAPNIHYATRKRTRRRLALA